MNARADGMPEGHPESRPVPLATLTLYASSTDPTHENFHAWGEVKIAGAYRPEEIDRIVPLVQDLFRGVLQKDPTVLEVECTCGRCAQGSNRGDRS